MNRQSWALQTGAMLFLIAELLATSFALGQIGVKTFRNTYVEFEIPDAWECQLDGTEFVCQEAGRSKVSMIAVIAGKIADPLRDNSAVYSSELAKRREWTNENGKLIISRVTGSGSRCYDGKAWSWGRHYQSELEGYYTEYFARVEGNVAALVTVSYHRSVESEGSAVAGTIARRLRVIGVGATSGSQATSGC